MGLATRPARRWTTLLEQAGYDEKGALRHSRKPASFRKDVPMVGTRLVREWDGERYEVTVVQGGFEFAGRRYRSLTAIAKAITGTHWNGPAFFGLRSMRKEGGR